MSNRSVMNRLYYVMFYAALAMLQDKEIGSSKHSGVIAVFDREFVKTFCESWTLLPKPWGALLINLSNSGNEGDDREYFELTKDQAEPLLDEAARFIVFAKRYLDQNLSQKND